MQAEIAMNIANALEAEFSPAEQARLESAPTDSPEAYALFLAALARGDDAPETRVDLLEQAVAIDPEFALAHADIAFALAQTTLNTINSSASRTWNDAGARATASAERALALDPNVEVAHAARAIIDQLSWRWPEARAGFARAYELNPNEPVVLWLYAWFSGFSGAAADAARLAERLGELRPNETEALAQQSVALAHAGDVDGAAATCRRALELEPDFVFCRHGLGINLARRGDVAGAMAQFELEEQLLGRNRLVAFLPDIAIAYSQIGRDDDVARLVAEVEAMGEQMDIGAGGHAAVYVAAGDREKALQWLRVAVEKAARHEPDAGFFELMSLRSNVFGHPMLDEPEFRELRAQLGVP
jgi:Tfp pilus assembly protein PilF